MVDAVFDRILNHVQCKERGDHVKMTRAILDYSRAQERDELGVGLGEDYKGNSPVHVTCHAPPYSHHDRHHRRKRGKATRRLAGEHHRHTGWQMAGYLSQRCWSNSLGWFRTGKLPQSASKQAKQSNSSCPVPEPTRCQVLEAYYMHYPKPVKYGQVIWQSTNNEQTVY